jgi:hypothetical protein
MPNQVQGVLASLIRNSVKLVNPLTRVDCNYDFTDSRVGLLESKMFLRLVENTLRVDVASPPCHR